MNHSGRPILHHRKTHLWGDSEKRIFDSAPALSTVVEMSFRHSEETVRVGLLICYEVWEDCPVVHTMQTLHNNNHLVAILDRVSGTFSSLGSSGSFCFVADPSLVIVQ